MPVTNKTPTLLVVVDTEEEFDWGKPHSRENTSVHAMSSIELGQKVFESYGVRPCYVADYPVVVQSAGIEPLKALHASGRAVIGAHLHPWVNPPHLETVSVRNSFPGNLPFEVERAKLRELAVRLEEALGEQVTVYKAGRYGVGPNTTRVLAELGFQIDLSPTPSFDYSSQGGPDFGGYSNDPQWLDRQGGVLSVPCTGAFVGRWASSGHSVYPAVSSGVLQRLRVPGILARLGFLERIRLSPEGFSLNEMIRLSRHLIERGTNVLTLSFHSPSLRPGCTPYVRSRADLNAFIARIRDYLEFFQSHLGGEFSTPHQVRDALIAAAMRATASPSTSNATCC